MTKKHFQSPFKLDSSTSSTSTSKVNNKLNQERQDHEHSRLKSMSRLREAWADIQSRHDHYQLHNTTQQIAGKTRALREEEDDIIDLFSMTVVIDRGVLRNAKSGSWAIGSYALPGGPIRRSNQGWDHEQLDHHQDDHPDDDWEELSEDDDDPMGQWNEVMDAPSVISRLAKRKRAEELDDLRMFLQDEARHQALLSTASTSPIDSTRSITSPIPTPIPIPIRGSEVLTALNNLPTGTGNVILPMALTGSGTSRGNTPSSFGSRGSREKSRAEMELEREEDELSIIIPSMPVIPITMPSRKGKEKATPPTTTRVEKVAPKKIRSTSLPLTLPVHAPVASSSKLILASTSAARSSRPIKSSPLRQMITIPSLPSPSPSPSPPPTISPKHLLRRSPRSHRPSSSTPRPTSVKRSKVDKAVVTERVNEQVKKQNPVYIEISDSEDEREAERVHSSLRPTSTTRSANIPPTSLIASITLPVASTTIPVTSTTIPVTSIRSRAPITTLCRPPLLPARVSSSPLSNPASLPPLSRPIIPLLRRSSLLSSSPIRACDLIASPSPSPEPAPSTTETTTTTTTRRKRQREKEDEDYIHSDEEWEKGRFKDPSTTLLGLITPPVSREKDDDNLALPLPLEMIREEEVVESTVERLRKIKILKRSPSGRGGSGGLGRGGFDAVRYMRAHSAPRQRSATPQFHSRAQSEFPSPSSFSSSSSSSSSSSKKFKTLILEEAPSLREEEDEEEDDELLLTPSKLTGRKESFSSIDGMIREGRRRSGSQSPRLRIDGGQQRGSSVRLS